MKIKIKSWQYEDEMTEDDMYNALFALSKVSNNGIGVRIFPKEIELITEASPLSGRISRSV